MTAIMLVTMSGIKKFLTFCLLSEIFGHGCPKKGLLSQDGESAPVSFVPDTSHRMSGTS